MPRFLMNRQGARVIAVVFFMLMPAPFQAAASERLTITATLANIRAGAGTDQPILWQVEKYFPIKVIQRSGDWIFFEDFEGDRGWVHDSLAGRAPAVITDKPVSNIREKPSTSSRILFKAEKGIPFKVLGRRGPWINVEHSDGDVGWIHDSLVW